MRTSTWLSAAFFILVIVALAGCGGTRIVPPAGNPSAPARNVGQPLGHVLRTTSGLPTGIKLTWTAQADAVSYNVYRSNTVAGLDSARGNATLQVATGVTAADFTDDFGAAAPLIGEKWYYRIGAVDADGDESKLSPQLEVDVTVHDPQSTDVPAAAPGQNVTINGQRFGIYNPAIDKVCVMGVVWNNTPPGVGFQVAELTCVIVSWNETQIVATIPDGFTGSPVEVEINGASAPTPLPVTNPAPYITSLTPVSGDITSTIDLQGNNFGAAQDPAHFVHFGTANITTPGSYVSYSNTDIKFHPANLRNFIQHPVQVSAAGVLSNTGFCTLQNAKPTVQLTGVPDTGFAPLTVNFDGSGSTDPEGTALTFDWDFTNDGIIDVTAGGPLQTHTYPAAGAFLCNVIVHDADGGTASIPIPFAITVNPPLNGDWSMFGHDRLHTHVSAINGPANPYPRRLYPTAAPVHDSPAFAADGTIYIGSDDGIFWAYNPDGTVKWRFPAVGKNGAVIGSPAVAPDGTIYFGDDVPNIYALNPNGTQKWVISAPVLPAATFTGIVIAADGTLYCGTEGPQVLRIVDTAFGGVLQVLPTGDVVRSTPAIAGDGTVYAGCDDGQLYAWHADGTAKWVLDMSGAGERLRSSPAINPTGPNAGTIYIGSDNGHLYAVTDNGNSATEKWTIDLGHPVFGSPAVGGPNGWIYVGTDERICAVSDDGVSATLQQVRDPGGAEPFSSVAIGADNKVYAGYDNNEVYCVDPTTLADLWPPYADFSGVTAAPSIGPDGVLYIGDANGLRGLGIANPRPPVPLFTPTPNEIGLGIRVDFAASATSPEIAQITKFEYDFDNDGTYDGTDNSPGPTAPFFAYPATGVFKPIVRVTDDNGQQAVFQNETVKVWSATTPLSTTCSFAKLAVINGHPAIAYLEPAAQRIMFTRSVDAAGYDWTGPRVQIWQSPTLVVNSDTLDLIAGANAPGVTYGDGADLIYHAALDVNGAGWAPAGTHVATTGGAIKDTALAVANGNPAVAYVDTRGNFDYVRATTPLGNVWNPAVPLDTGAVACDLAIVASHPAVTFVQAQNAWYFRSTTTNGDTAAEWPAVPRPVHAITDAFTAVALTQVQNPFNAATLLPTVLMLDNKGATLDVLSCTALDADFAGKDTVVGLHTGKVNGSIDLAFFGQRPCAIWGDGQVAGDVNKLLFERGNNFNATAWGTKVKLFDTFPAGTCVSLQNFLNKGAVAYVNQGANLIFSREPDAAPVAYLNVDTIGFTPPPVTVNFDATGSNDPDGAIADIKWQLQDGRGVFSAGPTGFTQQVTYNATGVYNCFVQIIDATGQTSTATVTINVL